MNLIGVKNLKNDRCDEGACAAIVRRNIKDSAPEHYLLSCYHLYALLASDISNPATHSGIFKEDLQIATYSGVAGKFAPTSSQTWSFDAAYALVDEGKLSAARKAVPGPKAQNILYYMDNLPKSATLHSPKGPIPLVDLDVKRGNQLIVSYGSKLNRITAAHRVVIEYTGATQPGDSGAPVIAPDNKTLLGMHIAGNGQRGYMLPAVDLIQNANAFIKTFKDDTLSLDIGG